MILRRIGNKKRLSEKIVSFFPKHEMYIEPFFGAGGIFFSKDLAKYNIVNDNDNEVFNLFKVLMERKHELYQLVSDMPIHESLMDYWKKHKETDPLFKAARFLFLSNFTYLGKGYTLNFGFKNDKKIIFDNFEKTYEKLKHVRFSNRDFKVFLNQIQFRGNEYRKAFIYCDPPYIGTTNNYEHSFKEKDTIDLFDILIKKNINFAVSEFESDFILDIAKQYKLNVNYIGERRNLNNRRVEIIITNYISNISLFNGT